MQALVLNGYGGSERLSIAEVPQPQPLAGEVRIRVSHAGLNPIDYKMRRGDMRLIRKLRFPQVMGQECAGVVDAVGLGPCAFAPGDEVFVRLDKDRMGGFAEYVCDRVENVALRPKSIAPEVAAGVPLVALTAWQCLFEKAKLERGQSILIHGAGGAVGRMAVQFARRAGAVIAATGGEWAEPMVCKMGASRYIDYRKQRFDELLDKYDVVLDLVGADTLDRSFSVVKEGGFVVSIAGMPAPETAAEIGKGGFMNFLFRVASRKQLKLARQTRCSYRYLFMRPDGAQLAEIAKLIDAGEIEATIDRVLPLSQFKEAFEMQESGKTRGKLVFAI